MKKTNLLQSLFAALVVSFFAAIPVMAGEASLEVPNIAEYPTSYNLLLIGLLVSVFGVIFGACEFFKVKKV